MLWVLADHLLALELVLYKWVSVAFRPLIALWSQTWVEWVVLQVLVIYTLVRIYTSVNYLRQVLAIMGLVVVACLYLALWQLELFSCFLFLGEFTILIFYYCLFLHLRASVSQSAAFGSYKMASVVIVASVLFISVWCAAWAFNADMPHDISILFIDLYRRVPDFILNDLVALYYFFVHANLAIHSIIGLLLFLLTLCLFLVVSLYAGLNIARRQAYKSTPSRLLTTKGYYEQTAVFTQKYFTQEDTNPNFNPEDVRVTNKR